MFLIITLAHRGKLTTIRNILYRILACIVVLSLLYGCEKTTGKRPFIYDLQVIDGKVYQVSLVNRKFQLTSDEVKIKDADDIVYCKLRNLYYYADDGLLSYQPDLDKKSQICDLSLKNFLCTTKDYVVAKTYEDENVLVNVDSDEIKKSKNVPDSNTIILDICDNNIFYWDDLLKSICKYDCEKDMVESLYSQKVNPSVTVGCGVFHKGSIYFAYSNGALNKISATKNNTISEKVFRGKVIGLTTAEDDIVMAVKEGGNIVFYQYDGNKKISEIGMWKNEENILSGSLLLDVTDEVLVCALKTEQKYFKLKLNEYN